MTHNKTRRQIEIEFRARFDQKKYQQLEEFLNKKAKDLGKDDKDVWFFILSDKLLKVVDNVSKGNAKIVLKLNKIGKGSDFEEIEIPIERADVEKAVRLFKNLNITDNIMHTFQKRHNYLYKGVEIALKWSEVWGYHLELEVLIEHKSQQKEAEAKIKRVAEELGVHLMTNKELQEFTQKAEREYQQKLARSSSEKGEETTNCF